MYFEGKDIQGLSSIMTPNHEDNQVNEVHYLYDIQVNAFGLL